MGVGIVGSPKRELHLPEIGVGRREIAVEADGELELAQCTLGRAHRVQDGPVRHMRLGAVRGQRQRLLRSRLGSAYLCEPVVGCVRHVDFPHVGVREANQRADIVLVELQRRLEKTAGPPCRLERQIPLQAAQPRRV
jgi:hypothetical protein